jgi:hypothetical protein
MEGASMVLEIVRAGTFGAVPVAFFTFLILQWSIASGRLNRFDSEKNLHRQYKKHSKAARKSRDTGLAADNKPLFHKRAAGDLFHNKVTFFGGGYYGTMAVLTYILIETVEIWQFLAGLVDPSTWINKIGLDLIIEFLISSITNLVAALVWFTTLPEYITVNNGFIWLGASYLGYLAGLRLTAQKGDWIWEKMPGWYDSAVQWLRSLRPGER